MQVTESVEAVVLAAGLSSRSSTYKLTLPLAGRSVVQRAVETLLPHVARMIVVLGWEEEVVLAELARHDRIKFVRNPVYREGMFSSVRSGVAAVTADRFFLQPADIPLVAADVPRQLLEAQGEVCIPTYHGRRGHPILLKSDVVNAVLQAPTSATLRDVLSAYAPTLVSVEDDGILLDIDTPADYEELQRRLAASGA